jgi:hypothetical protein
MLRVARTNDRASGPEYDRSNLPPHISKKALTRTPISFYIGPCSSPYIPIYIWADPKSRRGIILIATFSIERPRLQRWLDILFVIETTNLREPARDEGSLHGAYLADEVQGF